MAYLVVGEHEAGWYLDVNVARRHAQAERAVMVALPIMEDYRLPVTAGGFGWFGVGLAEVADAAQGGDAVLLPAGGLFRAV
jgi:hypothetical protein